MSLRSTAINAGLGTLAAWYVRRLSRYPELAEVVGSMKRPDGRASLGVSVCDYIALYEAVLDRKPRRLLELGAGRSSSAIALASSTIGNDASAFTAVEENPQWFENHKRTIPPHLLSRMDLIQRDALTKDTWGEPAAYYRDLPVSAYEFVHVDGPKMTAHGVTLSCDILDLLPHLSERCFIMFDGREKIARFSAPALKSAGFRMSRHPFTLSYCFTRDHVLPRRSTHP